MVVVVVDVGVSGAAVTRPLALLLLLAGPALAAPPPAGSPAAEELGRYSPAEREWISRQHDQAGRWCCDEGDFDFVTLRQTGDKVQAKAKHPGGKAKIPDGWLDVPDEKIVNTSGQTDVPGVIGAWYYNGHIQCILMGSGY